jgi:hypothetical protein
MGHRTGKALLGYGREKGRQYVRRPKLLQRDSAASCPATTPLKAFLMELRDYCLVAIIVRVLYVSVTAREFSVFK